MSAIPDQAPTYVSVVNELPQDLYEAMREFIAAHPNWDQYRLIQSALAGFLFQQGCQQRAVTQHYLNSLFLRPDGEQTPSTQPSCEAPSA